MPPFLARLFTSVCVAWVRILFLLSRSEIGEIVRIEAFVASSSHHITSALQKFVSHFCFESEVLKLRGQRENSTDGTDYEGQNLHTN